LFSSLDTSKEIRILSTDSEFYSFNRQANRFSELSNVHITKVETQPFHDFEERFITEAKKGNYDLIFFSHVFFNSGYACDIDLILKEIRSTASVIVVDGYHSF